jgi:hypothetical protein
MFNAKYIWPGIVLFVVLFTAPFWLNVGSDKYVRPELALPANDTECIESREYMAGEHMQILDTWRDMALREEKRIYVSTSGKEWVISLQNTCMTCHANKVDFCDKCHTSNSVAPYCWDCHVEPRGNNQ